MELKSTDEYLIRRYLLGDASDEERLAVEERFFADDDFYQSMLVAEDDLIYDYLRGAMGLHDRRLMEAQIAASPRRLQKVELVRGLMRSAESESRISFWQRLRDFFTPVRALEFATATLALALALGGYFMFRQSSDLRQEIARLEDQREAASERERESARQLEAERARTEELNLQLEREREEKERLAEEARRRQIEERLSTQSISLLPTTRDQQGVGRIIINKNTSRVTVKLDLEGDLRRSYRAEVRTSGGNLIWNQSAQSKRRSVTIQLPAGVLADGEYEVTLKADAGNGRFETINFYYFIVTKNRTARKTALSIPPVHLTS
ncbi:MAG: hypothetical protein AB1631_31885 [Acidobacteriota bacterium]